MNTRPILAILIFCLAIVESLSESPSLKTDTIPVVPESTAVSDLGERNSLDIQIDARATGDTLVKSAKGDSSSLQYPTTKKISSIGVLPGPEGEMISHSLTLDNKATKDSVNEVLQKGITKAFVGQNNTEVVAQVGGTATLSCYTGHISDEVVTWLKREDDQLLTIGQELYANENRFSASLSHASKAWELFVRDVQLSDAGHYECQLTTHPPVTFLYSLKVIQAKADIRSPKEVHIEEGSQLDLQCYVKDSPLPPVYIFWYHNGSMVNYERQRGLQVHLENFMSSLVVGKVTPSDAGIYTCDPHLATRASVIVHVVTGEKPAAMQHGRNQVDSAGSCFQIKFTGSNSSFYFFFLLLLPLFFLKAQDYLLEETFSYQQLSSSELCSSSISSNWIYG